MHRPQAVPLPPGIPEAREANKFSRIMSFADALPAIRRRIDADMRRKGFRATRLLATVVHLLETTLIRVGNDDYARTNRSYGLTTLRGPACADRGIELTFRFMGKSGKEWNVSLKDRRVARIVKACQTCRGRISSSTSTRRGERRDVTSSDVNAYLREITGETLPPRISEPGRAPCWRRLGLRAFEAFRQRGRRQAERPRGDRGGGLRLGNTRRSAGKCYIHPEILDCYLEGGLIDQMRGAVGIRAERRIRALRPEEAAVLGLLQTRLARVQASAKAKRNGRVKAASGEGRQAA